MRDKNGINLLLRLLNLRQLEFLRDGLAEPAAMKQLVDEQIVEKEDQLRQERQDSPPGLH